MARRRRGCFFRLLLLIMILLVAAGLAVSFLPLTPLKSGVEARLSSTLGRKVTIDSVRLSLTNGPCLAITGMTAQESNAFGDGAFLRANDVRAGFSVVELLRSRRIVLNWLTIKSPQIQLVKNGDGLWNWATLGQSPVERTGSSGVARCLAITFSPVAALMISELSPGKLKEITVEDATVRLIDRSRPGSEETLYKHISVTASLVPPPAAVSGETDVKGELTARSEEDGEAEVFKATLPFDLKIQRQSAELTVSGKVGAGPFETRNISVESFAIDGRIASTTSGPLTGDGRITATNMFLPTINLSQKVAEALKIQQIGNMEAGTSVASLETAFQISRGAVSTTGLRLQQVDGLGDATAQSGSFKIEAALTVSYAATVTLSADATSRVKSASTMLGILTTIFETNNRISVPINVSGDMRHPQVQVDVTRIF